MSHTEAPDEQLMARQDLGLAAEAVADLPPLTLGPLEAKVVLSLRERGREAVDVSDIRTLAGPGSATRNVVQQLIRKGWLTRVRRGRYVLLPPEHGPDNLGENNVLALATAAR